MNYPGTGSPHPYETSRATQKETLAIDQLTAGASKPSPTDYVCEEGRSCMVLQCPAVHLRDRVVGSSDMSPTYDERN